MLKLIKLALFPIKYAWVLGIALAIGVGTGIVHIPGVSAQEAPGCGELVERQCIQLEQSDVCWNIPEFQVEVPAGYHIDESQDNACVKDPEPQVLGEATTEPQVLAETTGK